LAFLINLLINLIFTIMKKRILSCGLITLFAAFSVSGQVWRLNNQPGVSADFTTTLQDAIDGVSPGDTIYVEPTPFSYGPATISKKVILIGAGYWHEENESTSANNEKSIVGELIFNPGSEGSIVTGLYINSQYGYGGNFNLITINADNINLKRNFIFGEILSGGGNSRVHLRINGNRAGLLIEQNWIKTDNETCTHGILITGTANDIIIRNNFIHGSSNQFAIEQTSGSVSLIIKNNVLWGKLKTNNALYVNNILLTGTFTNGTGGLVANNICNAEQFPVTNNNLRNVDMSTVFVNHTSFIDNGYHLKPGSPAIGAGFNGGNCGAFSYDFGGNAYVLSGMPNIPTIFEMNINNTIFPSNEFEFLEVNIKARSQN